MPAGDIRGACTTIRSSAQHVDFKEPNIEYRRNSFFIENGMLTPAQIHKRRERYSSLETEITTQSANYKGRKRWKMELPLLLEKVGREHANRNKLVALRTLQLRRQTMFHFFSELDELGYKLPSIYSFREKHARVLFSHWEEAGVAAATLQSRYTCMQLFATWIGKYDMLQQISKYLRNPLAGKRTYVAMVDKSWDVNGVLADEVIEKAIAMDKYVGLQLRLIKAFGLRRKEAVCFRPHSCYNPGTEAIEVFHGTKGGRHRLIQISNDEQRAVIADCLKMVRGKTDHIGNPEKTLEQNLRRLQYVLERLGITKEKMGVTAHGLRHEYANGRYQNLTGEKSPLQGGPTEIFRTDETLVARRKVAEELGHSRLRVTTAYYGSDRASVTKNKLRKTAQETAQEYLASSSPLDAHFRLILKSLEAGLGAEGAIHALATVGVQCTELELDQWIAEFAGRTVRPK